jgi:hypothetical protein
MFSASVYITVCSIKNRIRVRLRRLREPKYLIGAIVGAAYLYFTIFARMWGRRASTSRRAGRSVPPNVPLAAIAASGPALVGIALMIMMAAAWLFPSDSSLLEFTEPEIQFLFTAPVTRRQLLIHRLMRSQLPLLFAAIVPALLFPSALPGSRAKFAISIWIILMTMKVHFTGITLVRTSLTLQGADVRRRQWGALALMLGAVGIVGAAIARVFLAHPLTGISDSIDRLGVVATAGVPHVILWPFMTLARPLFAAWPGPYLLAVALALGVLALNIVWVLTSDAAFQEAAAQAEARRAAKKLRKMPVPRARATSWTLPPSGRVETVFLWKNVMQMLRETNIATAFRYGAPFLGVAMAMSATMLRHNPGASALLGMLAAAAAAITILLGPQMARTDLRQDLLHLELLKTWPVRGSDVIRGEMLWPAALLTMIGWLAIGVAMVFWTAAFPPSMLVWRVSGALAAVFLAPALVSAQFTIHNAAAVVFPAWVPLGTSRPRGIDAMGQRLIMFVGVLVGLVAMMAPGVIVGGVIGLAFWRLIGPAVLVPAAAVCAVIVLVEVLAVTEALGPVYERLDLSGVERSE